MDWGLQTFYAYYILAEGMDPRDTTESNAGFFPLSPFTAFKQDKFKTVASSKYEVLISNV